MFGVVYRKLHSCFVGFAVSQKLLSVDLGATKGRQPLSGFLKGGGVGVRILLLPGTAVLSGESNERTGNENRRLGSLTGP